MKTYTNQSVAALLILILMGGCAQPVFKLSPVAEQYIWNEGRQVVKQEQDSLKIVTSFDGEMGEYLVFDTEIFNRTSQNMDFNPTDFVGVMLNKNQDTIRLAQYNNTPAYYFAIDPDQKIRENEIAMRRAEARLKRARVIHALLLVANVVGDVASATSNRPKSVNEWTRERNLFATNYDVIAASNGISHINYQTTMGRLSHERGNWEVETLRRTTLRPGESLRGFIYIHKLKQAAYLRLTYRGAHNANPIQFLFRQEAFRPNPRGSQTTNP
jgi:hypothetical protein